MIADFAGIRSIDRFDGAKRFVRSVPFLLKRVASPSSTWT